MKYIFILFISFNSYAVLNPQTLEEVEAAKSSPSTLRDSSRQEAKRHQENKRLPIPKKENIAPRPISPPPIKNPSPEEEED